MSATPRRILTTLCVVLLVSTLALWVRGRGRRDALQYSVLGATGSAGSDQIVGVEFGDGTITFAYLRMDTTPFPVRPAAGWQAHVLPQRGSGSLNGVLGFNFWARSFGVTPGTGPATQFGFQIPYWAIAVVLMSLLVIPTRLAWRSALRLRRQRLGQCLACGYDLRATPGRCPECGDQPVGTRAAAIPV